MPRLSARNDTPSLTGYSCRIASMGESLAARSAGNVPNRTPILTAEAIEMRIVDAVMAA